MLQVKTFVFNALAVNTYVIYDDEKRLAIVIDPGCYTPEEEQTLSEFIEQQELLVMYVVNTHAHIDHVVGNRYVQSTYNVPVIIHKEDLPTLEYMKQHAADFGFDKYRSMGTKLPISSIHHVIQLGNTSLDVMHAPGHSPGHVVLYSFVDKCVFSGDTLMRGTIGRTDLPGGDYYTLMKSIRRQLLCKMTDEIIVYPGHGPSTTIGEERKNNIALREGLLKLSSA